MSTTDLVPRSPLRGVVAVWAFALALGLLVALLAPRENATVWFGLALGATMIASFAVQLAFARSTGFVTRVGASTLGSLVILGIVSALVGVAGLLG